LKEITVDVGTLPIGFWPLKALGLVSFLWLACAPSFADQKDDLQLYVASVEALQQFTQSATSKQEYQQEFQRMITVAAAGKTASRLLLFMMDSSFTCEKNTTGLWVQRSVEQYSCVLFRQPKGLRATLSLDPTLKFGAVLGIDADGHVRKIESSIQSVDLVP